jgi:PadR family transcriptional regulator, regulatory protein PadR
MNDLVRTPLHLYIYIARISAMEPLARITAATVDVLRSLRAEGPDTWGLRIVKATGRPAGTVYPILERLERSGWVESQWELGGVRSGPRRRLYRLTAPGAQAAVAIITAQGVEPQGAGVDIVSPRRVLA